MNNKIIIAIAIAVAISLPLTILALSGMINNIARAPGIAVKELISAASGIFDNKTDISSTSSFIKFTPISEIALAKQTVKMTTVYKRTWMGSECLVVAEQNFTVKYGYDSKTVFKIMRNGGEIDVPEPLVLSTEPATGAPKILYKVGGWYNGVNPEDILELTNDMHRRVKSDEKVNEFKRIIQDIIKSQMKSLQKEIDKLK